MKKTLKLTEIDCANCAAKLEKNINKLSGVESATVVFLTKKVLLEVKDDCDWADLLKGIAKEAKKIERDCEVIEQ